MKITFRFHMNGSASQTAEIRFELPRKSIFREIALEARLPIVQYSGHSLTIDSGEYRLPPEYLPNTPFILVHEKTRELTLVSSETTLRLSGPLQILLQDNRKFHKNYYALRLQLPISPDGHSAKLMLKAATEQHRCLPLDLSGICNMGFSDSTAGDRCGGWTDQGPANDLRMLPVGKKRWNGTDFLILDPKTNGGASCVMLSAENRSGFPASATAGQHTSLQGNYLYLLHAAAWGKNGGQCGDIRLHYTNGEEECLSIRTGRDVGNWWKPSAFVNAEVAWTGENQRSVVGLYRSRFSIRNLPIQRITFHATGDAVWGIVAASVSQTEIPIRQEAPFYILPGPDWKEIELFQDTLADSILDFSGNQDAPAGKYGPVVIRNGHFEFRDRPNVPLRFYGTNLCGTAQFLKREWAEKLAERLARAGYNAVRLHHHDNILALHRNGRSSELNPETLDQLEYLIACLKKRGIYIVTDLYVSRQTEPGEIPEFPGKQFSNTSYKPLPFLLDSALENWKTFSRNWLTHRNPYTGLALKDDPVLISLSLINEDNLSSCWDASEESRELFIKRFEIRKRHHNQPQASTSRDDIHFSAFLTECYQKGTREMCRFLRQLGVSIPLSDQNMATQPLLAIMRNDFDFVENHFYWSHPIFPTGQWKLPSQAENTRSAIAARGGGTERISPSRIFGKPFMVTEFDYAKPNFNRAEGPVLAAAYAALQDWSGLFHFAYAHNREKIMNDISADGHFDSSVDPVKFLSQRIGAYLFLTGGLKPAKQKFAVQLPNSREMSFDGFYPEEIRLLGLTAQIGTRVQSQSDRLSARQEFPVMLDAGMNFPESVGANVYRLRDKNSSLFNRLHRETGIPLIRDGVFPAANEQFTLDSKRQTFQLQTPMCEVQILPPRFKASGAFMNIYNFTGRCVFAALSTDRRELKKSNRILLLHLTDSQNTGTKFADQEKTRLADFGHRPFLAAAGRCRVELRLAANQKFRLYANDTSGKRLAEIPLKPTPAGTMQFDAEVFRKEGSILVYELAVK